MYRIFAVVFLLFVLFLGIKGIGAVIGFLDRSRAGQRETEFTQPESQNSTALSESASSAPQSESASAASSAGSSESADPTKILSGGRYIDSTKPLVALTFDDGPDQQIDQIIMDELEKVNGRATFFVVGQRVQRYSADVKSMAERGHEIGNHSWDHDIRLSRKGESYISSEFSKTDDAVRAVTGSETALIRLPGGTISDDVKRAVKKPLIYWTVDTDDWKSRNAQSVVDIVMNQVKDGDIILMHSLYLSTAEACRTIIPELSARGYQLVTVSEMIALRHAEVQGGNGKQYDSFPPNGQSLSPAQSQTTQTQMQTTTAAVTGQSLPNAAAFGSMQESGAGVQTSSSAGEGYGASVPSSSVPMASMPYESASSDLRELERETTKSSENSSKKSEGSGKKKSSEKSETKSSSKEKKSESTKSSKSTKSEETKKKKETIETQKQSSSGSKENNNNSSNNEGESAGRMEDAIEAGAPGTPE